MVNRLHKPVACWVALSAEQVLSQHPSLILYDLNLRREVAVVGAKKSRASTRGLYTPSTLINGFFKMSSARLYHGSLREVTILGLI